MAAGQLGGAGLGRQSCSPLLFDFLPGAASALHLLVILSTVPSANTSASTLMAAGHLVGAGLGPGSGYHQHGR